ncbi:hypothetical protein FKM82_015709 [Ascaphus truei]|uniref:tissue factor pathway inhibitor n=1 Tax=Ascaphus truei TaxID=8439 RepID=UPI003F592D69
MRCCCVLICAGLIWQCVETLDSEDRDQDLSGTQLPPLVLKHSVCGLKQDGGSCKASLERFYFNIYTRKCEHFEYGGCGGNENNFETKEECREKCVIKEPSLEDPPKKGRKKIPQGMPEFCLQEEDPGICRGYLSRYFYNRMSKKCEKFKYGGCLGNRNNFMTVDECQTTCEILSHSYLLVQPEENIEPENISFSSNTPATSKLNYSGSPMCLAPATRGTCNTKERRFYFNHLSGKCHPFLYSGCGGTENNFISRKSCMKVCKKGKNRGQQDNIRLNKEEQRRKI